MKKMKDIIMYLMQGDDNHIGLDYSNLGEQMNQIKPRGHLINTVPLLPTENLCNIQNIRNIFKYNDIFSM